MTDTEQNEAKRPLIIYHGGCRDGFCAAWVCHLALKEREPEFFAGYYGQLPPICVGRDVVIVDFSYPLEVMHAIATTASSLLVLDHHRTAQAALAELAANPPPNTKIVFDMEQSGAGLAWSHYFQCYDETGGDPLTPLERPYLVDYTEDRDLWRHALPDSKVINAYLSTLPFTFEAWSEAFTTSQQDIVECMGDRTRWARQQGASVEAKTKQYVAEVRKNAMVIEFEGYAGIPIVNAPQVDISELLHAMCIGDETHAGPTFAMGWWQRADGLFQYSLRSVGNFDVSALAKKCGGGGHKNAAGFESHNLLHTRLP